jgi:asparagine synthase (glutamine-hydrolysing)
MVSVLNQPINTFSVTFSEKKYSESHYSQLIADSYRTRHTEIKLKSGDFLQMLPHALDDMDHPSGDGPNTWVVSKVTKDAGITMALSGLGGDELFAGYEVFKRLKYLYKLRAFAYIPKQIRALPVKLLMQVNNSVAAVKLKELMKLQSWQLQYTYPISREVLSDQMISRILKFPDVSVNSVESIVKDLIIQNKKTHFLSMVSEAEISTYLQNVLLRDTDQMSMASALEVRVPFLDYALVEYILQVPDNIKYPHTPKKLLTDSMMGILPKGVVNRRKMGFTLPWDDWMRVELKAFCESRIQLLGRCEYFNHDGLMDIWQRFIKRDPLITWSRIWPMIALSNWMTNNGVS